MSRAQSYSMSHCRWPASWISTRDQHLPLGWQQLHAQRSDKLCGHLSLDLWTSLPLNGPQFLVLSWTITTPVLCLLPGEDLGYLQMKKDLTSELAVRDKEDTQPGQTFFLSDYSSLCVCPKFPFPICFPELPKATRWLSGGCAGLPKPGRMPICGL